jgi:hypothetical protein
MSSKKNRQEKRKKQDKWRRKKQEKRIETSKSELAERIKEQKEFSDSKIIVEPPGQVKMSKVIVDFIEPFMEFAEDEEAEEFVVMAAIMAWNSNLIPPQEQKKFIKNFRKKMGTIDAELFKIMLSMMRNYKEENYPDLKRFILDYQLLHTQEGMHLNVVSSMEPPKSEE